MVYIVLHHIKMIQIKDFKPRLYQETILESCDKANCLVVLPTGLGKTKIGILASVNRLNKFPDSKILFLTPTKPLAAQIANEFKTNTNVSNVALFTGEISPDEREGMWKDSIVIVSTPQCIENDIINDKVPLEKISLIIFDEAHRAVKEYAYKFLAKQYKKKGSFPRILGLTASPGSRIDDVQEICKNLYIEDIEYRNEDSPDVKDYVQDLNIEYIKVDFPDELKDVRKFLQDCLKSKLDNLKEFGLINSTNLSKSNLIELQRTLQGKIARGQRDIQVLKGVSLVAEAVKVDHALVMLESQGVNALFSFMNKLREEADKGKTKATKNLVRDLNFRSAFVKLNKLIDQGVEHPKLYRLVDLIKKEIDKDNKIKIIVFNHYRNGASKIEAMLKDLNIKSRVFVGQAKKDGLGLSQKRQIEIIDEFGKEKFNVLIATSVGEEGLDIPEVDLIVFYEPVPSAIRSIQRRGRTARHKKGRVVILITKNTRDETYFWIAHHKEKNMYKILEDLKNKINRSETGTKLDSFSKEQRKIFVDSREEGGVAKKLVELGVNVEMKRLDVADYIVSNRVGIEKKSIRDFVDSIIDKRLLHQVKDLKDNFERPLIIIEGEEDIYSVRKMHANAIRGMLAAIVVDYGIPIIWTKNFMETAAFLNILAKREQENKYKDFGIRVDKKPLTTKELQEFIVESLPGVGPILAKSLLRKFKSVKGVVESDKDRLEEVDKMGPKKANDIHNILREDYSD